MTTTRAAFHAMAAEHRAVPVWREIVADMTTPLAAFARTVGGEPGFLLESVDRAEQWSRFSFVGRRPLATLKAFGPNVTVTGDLPAELPCRTRGAA